MKEEEKKVLYQIVKKFRKGLLEDEKSEGACFTTSCALGGYLHFLGYDCIVTEGTIKDSQHYWITLPNGIIIDATADQFNDPYGDKMPQVYMGTKPDWYEEL